jgi:micrococcal nuclease
MGMRVGRRLAIAGLLIGLAACSAADDPLDELSVGERGRAVRVLDGAARVRVYPETATANAPLLALEAAARADGRRLWDDGVWPIHNAAQLPPQAERFQIVEGVAGAMQGSALILEIGKSAAELCQLPEGTRIRASGVLRDGRLEVSFPLNLEKLD